MKRVKKLIDKNKRECKIDKQFKTDYCDKLKYNGVIAECLDVVT